MGRATARAPGSCGGLVQGTMDGAHFHVTCPIDRYATAAVELSDGGTGAVRGPLTGPKARRAVSLTLEALGRGGLDATVALEGSLPRGKGMASSTADVVAAAAATGAALGVRLSPGQLAAIALRVEPSDGVMLGGIGLFDHRTGAIQRSLGPAPRMRVLVLDFGGTVDTVAFNEVDRFDALRRLEPRWREALDLVEEGVRAGDPYLVGEGATLSALTHDRVVPNPRLHEVLALSKSVGAVGVNVAHSGTVLGLLLGHSEERAHEAARRAWEALPGLRSVRPQRLVGGGCTIVDAEVQPDAAAAGGWRPPR